MPRLKALRRVRPHNEKDLGIWLVGEYFFQGVYRKSWSTPTNFSIIGPQSRYSVN
jgi:hypothetical protein